MRDVSVFVSIDRSIDLDRSIMHGVLCTHERTSYLDRCFKSFVHACSSFDRSIDRAAASINASINLPMRAIDSRLIHTTCMRMGMHAALAPAPFPIASYVCFRVYLQNLTNLALHKKGSTYGEAASTHRQKDNRTAQLWTKKDLHKEKSIFTRPAILQRPQRRRTRGPRRAPTPR